MRIVVLCLAVLLSACASREVIRPPVEPVDLRCHSACFMSCDLETRWTPASDDAVAALDALIEEVLLPLVSRLQLCETRRRSCVACIERGRQLDIIR